MKIELAETINNTKIVINDVIELNRLPCGEIIGNGDILYLTQRQEYYNGVAVLAIPEPKNAVFYSLEFGVFDKRFLFRRIVTKANYGIRYRNWAAVAGKDNNKVIIECDKVVGEACHNYNFEIID